MSEHPSLTFSCLVATSGTIGNRSDAAFPELSTTLRMQPTNDSVIYLTPCSFSSDERPVNGGMECELDASLALWEGSKGAGGMGQRSHLGLRFMELGVLNSWSTFGSTHTHADTNKIN